MYTILIQPFLKPTFLFKPGNPKPRMFRLKEDNAVINRYGFNSEGHDAVSERLNSRLRSFLYNNGPVEVGSTAVSELPHSLSNGRLLGVNLGKNKISAAESNADYVDGVIKLGRFADYIVVNVSSPNTPGLRALQRREPMERLMSEVL
jgi:dihydroorotate dehydrogenase